MAFAQVSQPNGPSPDDLTQATNLQLIDLLAGASEFGIGFHPTAWTSGFVAIDEEPSFRGGIFGSSKPVTNPAMKELVRRGVKALPDLMAHLSDTRPTSMKIGSRGATWHSDEFDNRPPPGKPKAEGVNTGNDRGIKKSYALRVGDLCYVAIGQIVNRHYSAVRYQPSMCFVINSPVETSALARAVEAQWGGLTVEEHRQSLVREALDMRPYADWGAWQRVRFYYPELGEEIALQKLKRPFYDDSKLWEFIQNKLVKQRDESNWQPLIDKHAKANGVACKSVLPFWLYWYYFHRRSEDTPEFLADRENAGRILAKIAPEFDFQQPAIMNAVRLSDQIDALAALCTYPSPQIDNAVFGLLIEATHFKFSSGERDWLTPLVEACLDRLGRMRYQANGDPETLLAEIKRLIASQPASPDGYRDTRYVAFRAGLRYFPRHSEEIFKSYRARNPKLTREAKTLALQDPTDPQPWMTAFLASLLDDTTKINETYGPEWDRQHVRVCDRAAYVLAHGYLPESVRFEYEENPEYLTQQIAKIRRVLAGDMGIPFADPAILRMPQNLPTRAEARLVESPDLGEPYPFSYGNQLWVGKGQCDASGYLYETLRFDLPQGKLIERTPLDTWKGGVSLLRNGPADRAHCYHGYEGGHVVIRGLPSGNSLRTIATPFHNRIEADPLQIRSFNDATLCGRDSRWMLALTEDLKLHSVDLTTGEHRIEWEYEPKDKKDRSHSGILGIGGSSRAMLQALGNTGFSKQSLRVWDQSTRTMAVVEKCPPDHWQSGWGKLAWNNKHRVATLWNLDTMRQIQLPEAEQPVNAMTTDSDQSTLFVLRGGAVDVFRIANADALEPIQRLTCAAIRELMQPSLVVSSDDGSVFVHGWRKPKDEDSRECGPGVIVIFDVADLTK